MNKKLSKPTKRYLRENYRTKSDSLLAGELGVSEEAIRKSLEQLQLKRTEAELKALESPGKGKKQPGDKGRTPSSRKWIIRAAAFLGIVFLGIIVYFILTRWLAPGRTAVARDVRSLLGGHKSTDINLLFITLDTTRADHIGCYGYNLIETPVLDGLARKGFQFKTAISQAPLTLPSHSAIFTGTYSFSHGVRDNGGFYLEPDKVTLAEVLQKEGWATSAFVAAFVLDSRWGLDQGFDYYYDNFDFAKYKKISLDSVQREGGEVISAFFDWLDQGDRQRFFSWIHLYDPHTPYEPPEPYKTKYANRAWGLYDGEIAYVDSLVGKVLDKLEKKGLLEKTIIVIAGDHGESLGEHHENSHGFFIYNATVAVPLIISLPSAGAGGRTIEPQVQLVDIMPTLLELLGISAPQGSQGKSFLPLLEGRKPDQEHLAYSESFFSSYHYGWSELKGLRSAEYAYIQAPKPELYDLIRDPGERSNIYSEKPGVARKLAQELKSLEEAMTVEGMEERGPQKLDAESREKLMALGYIGGFTSSSKRRSKNPADPKDKILLYNRIKKAEGLSADRKNEEAKAELDAVISEDPGIMEALQVRAQINIRLDNFEEAVRDCQAALKIDPEYDEAIYTLALAYKEQKKYEEAIAGYHRIIELDPRDAKPYLNLGEIYIGMKDLDKAITHLKVFIERDPEMSSVAHNLLGSAYLEKKMLAEAEQEILKSLEMRPRIPDAHYNLGLLYEERKDFERAIEEYKKEIEIHPAAHPAHFNLALLLGKMGNVQEQVEHLKEAIRHEEKFAKGYLFLAKAYLDLGENFEEAVNLAKKGLELNPESDAAPLGHYVLADIYNRWGRPNDASLEVRKGQELERRLKAKKES